MEITSLAFRNDLALLALSGSVVEDRGTHVVVRTPDNPGFRWGNFHLLSGPPAPADVDAVLAAYDADFPDVGFRTSGDAAWPGPSSTGSRRTGSTTWVRGPW